MNLSKYGTKEKAEIYKEIIKILYYQNISSLLNIPDAELINIFENSIPMYTHCILKELAFIMKVNFCQNKSYNIGEIQKNLSNKL